MRQWLFIIQLLSYKDQLSTLSHAPIGAPSSRYCQFTKYSPFTCNMYSFCGYIYFLWAFYLSSKQVILRFTSLQTNLHALYIIPSAYIHFARSSLQHEPVPPTYQTLWYRASQSCPESVSIVYHQRQHKVCATFLHSYRCLTTCPSQPIIDVIPEAASQVNIDVTEWTPAQTRGLWSRIATEWKKRADTAGVLWGTKQGKHSRSSEITARLFTTSGDIISCRPLERIHSSPFPLPILPAQVFILMVASETMATTNGKIAAYINGPLPFKLKISERLVRACIYSSFQHTASVFLGHNQVNIHQFLLAPISLLVSPSPFLIDLLERAISGIYESSSSSRDVVFEWRLKLVSILILILISALHCVKPS